jgi:hypothetical protein
LLLIAVTAHRAASFSVVVGTHSVRERVSVRTLTSDRAPGPSPLHASFPSEAHDRMLSTNDFRYEYRRIYSIGLHENQWPSLGIRDLQPQVARSTPHLFRPSFTTIGSSYDYVSPAGAECSCRCLLTPRRLCLLFKAADQTERIRRLPSMADGRSTQFSRSYASAISSFRSRPNFFERRRMWPVVAVSYPRGARK